MAAKNWINPAPNIGLIKGRIVESASSWNKALIGCEIDQTTYGDVIEEILTNTLKPFESEIIMPCYKA